jgi:serine kinase of HPr protein (carbohydrate metabolism regulator)
MSVDEAGSETIHATCIALDGRGILLCGVPGSGKSDLALRLLDRGAKLVSDDYTVLKRRGEQLVASAPANIAGKIEVRGIGIVAWPAISEAPVFLCLALDQPVERMPEEKPDQRAWLGISVPLIALNALEPSAPLKAELAVRDLIDAVHNNSEIG